MTKFETPVILGREPETDFEAATKKYVDDNAGGGGGTTSALVPIEQVVVGAGGQTTITFPSIPQDYEDLEVHIMGRGAAAAAGVYVLANFNNDTGTNYAFQQGASQNTAQNNTRLTGQTFMRCGALPAGTATADKAGMGRLLIPGYARTTFQKTMEAVGRHWTGTAGPDIYEWSGDWANTSAITEIDLTTNNGDFAEGTVATLWGRGTNATGSGTAVYTETVGDASATGFDITHNLGTRNIVVQTWDTTGAGGEYNLVEADVASTGLNTARVEFATAPSTNQILVVITGGADSSGAELAVTSADTVTIVNQDLVAFTANETKTILDITSGGATLVMGQITGGAATFKVTIDGTVVIDTITTTLHGGGDDVDGSVVRTYALPLCKADDTLKIEVKNTSGVSRDIGWMLMHK